MIFRYLILPRCSESGAACARRAPPLFSRSPRASAVTLIFRGRRLSVDASRRCSTDLARALARRYGTRATTRRARRPNLLRIRTSPRFRETARFARASATRRRFFSKVHPPALPFRSYRARGGEEERNLANLPPPSSYPIVVRGPIVIRRASDATSANGERINPVFVGRYPGKRRRNPLDAHRSYAINVDRSYTIRVSFFFLAPVALLSFLFPLPLLRRGKSRLSGGATTAAVTSEVKLSTRLEF